MGVCQDVILSQMYAMARSLCIADGPTEVHLRSIANMEIKKFNSKIWDSYRHTIIFIIEFQIISFITLFILNFWHNIHFDCGDIPVVPYCTEVNPGIVRLICSLTNIFISTWELIIWEENEKGWERLNSYQK